MKRLIATTLVLGVMSIGMMGCNENKSSSKREMKIDTPTGTTTITTEKEVKETPDSSRP